MTSSSIHRRKSTTQEDPPSKNALDHYHHHHPRLRTLRSFQNNQRQPYKRTRKSIIASSSSSCSASYGCDSVSSASSESSTTEDDSHHHQQRRRRLRGTDASIEALAHAIVVQRKRVVFITGAGLSVPSGVRPFRSSSSTTSTTSNVTTLGLWKEVVWQTATRQAFRKNPYQWYAEFWIPHFTTTAVGRNHHNPRPNLGHIALDTLLRMFPHTVHQIAQNIDGLQQQSQSSSIIEIHGRATLFRCCPDPDEDSSTSSSSSEDEDSDEEEDTHDTTSFHARHSYPLRSQRTTTTSRRAQHSLPPTKKPTRTKVRLGSHRQCQKYQIRTQQQTMCPYQYAQAWTFDNHHSHDDDRPFQSTTSVVEPKQSSHSNNINKKKKTENDKDSYSSGDDTTTTVTTRTMPFSSSSCASSATTTLNNHSHTNLLPTCPACGNVGLPLALLFDEGYHSHSFYQFERAEQWLEQAELLVFVGTSFAPVRLTHVALQHARRHHIPVYNINVADTLESTAVLNASNILGSAHEVLPQLLQTCQSLLVEVSSSSVSSSSSPPRHPATENELEKE